MMMLMLSSDNICRECILVLIGKEYIRRFLDLSSSSSSSSSSSHHYCYSYSYSYSYSVVEYKLRQVEECKTCHRNHYQHVFRGPEQILLSCEWRIPQIPVSVAAGGHHVFVFVFVFGMDGGVVVVWLVGGIPRFTAILKE